MATRLENKEMTTTQAQAPAFGMGAGMGALSPRAINEMATVYSQMAIAQSCPRNMAAVDQRLNNICAGQKLALASKYAYAKGGTDINGPSIRLAEAVASVYGNFKYGFEVLSSDNKESKVRAYAFDMETNTQAERIFTVPHRRDTKNGSYEVKDAREIYELEANFAARRMRACILEVIPMDVIEYAMNKCDETVKLKVNVTAERVSAMVKAFAEWGVSKKIIEAYIQRSIEAIQPPQFARLYQIYGAIKDGMGKPEDYFDMTEDKKTSPAKQTETEKVEEPVQASEPTIRENGTVAENATTETDDFELDGGEF